MEENYDKKNLKKTLKSENINTNILLDLINLFTIVAVLSRWVPYWNSFQTVLSSSPPRSDRGQLRATHMSRQCHQIFCVQVRGKKRTGIRYFPFLSRSLQLPPEAWLRMSIGNCGITKISIRPNGRVSLREMGGTGHLPPELITFNWFLHSFSLMLSIYPLYYNWGGGGGRENIFICNALWLHAMQCCLLSIFC